LALVQRKGKREYSATLTEFNGGYSALWSFYPEVPKLQYCE